MGQVYEAISDELRGFIEAQHVFFVATAPRDGAGHINLSPKALDAFRVLTPTRVGYLDLTGSGNETSAHIADNGRVTFMFCAFAGEPRIVRLYGHGRTILDGAPEWPELRTQFPDITGARQIIVADVHRVSTSCGYGVPLFEYQGQRDNLIRWAVAKEAGDGVRAYQQKRNRLSIDGLPSPLSWGAPSGPPKPPDSVGRSS